MGLRKPVIGIPVNLLLEKTSPFPAVERTFVNLDYVRALRQAGAVPLLLPLMTEPDDIEAQLACMDGILLPGGDDLDPRTFGEEPLPGLGCVYPEVDAYQLAVARRARALGLPMLGICRGLQVMNVAFGGTLHQDLEPREGRLQHVQKSYRWAATHAVELVAGTRLQGLFGTTEVVTNSFHHQAVKDLAPGFGINARAKDGIVEGIEQVEGPFALAVQWHPEGMFERHPAMLAVFQALVEACGARAAAR